MCLTAHYLPESHIDHGVFTRLITLSLRADRPVSGERRSVCVCVCVCEPGADLSSTVMCVCMDEYLHYMKVC